MNTKKVTPSYEDYVKGIKELKPEEQLNLVEIISAQLKKSLAEKKIKHNIMELEGLGAELWKGIDAQEYVRKERDSWG
jgi:hypothetical protein